MFSRNSGDLGRHVNEGGRVGDGNEGGDGRDLFRKARLLVMQNLNGIVE